jgi:hypothetical protein
LRPSATATLFWLTRVKRICRAQTGYRGASVEQTSVAVIAEIQALSLTATEV